MTTTPDYDPSRSVSYSSMTLHRTCPQAWTYRYLRGLEPISLGVARDLGSWWHLLRALDSLERGAALDSLRSIPARLRGGDDYTGALELVDDTPTAPLYRLPDGRTAPAQRTIAYYLTQTYWRTLDGETREVWADALGGCDLTAALARMDQGWQDTWADDLRHEAPLGVEVRFSRDLPGTDGARLPGVIDEVYLDTRRNLLVVRDHKTHGKMPTQEALDDLTDSQLHLYAWGVLSMVSDWGHGPVRAVSYDRARSTAPKTPVLTASGALSKSVTDYDLNTYLTWAQGPDGQGVSWGEPDTYVKTGRNAGKPKFGVYQAEESVIEKLSTPAARSIWFQRTLTPLNRNVIVSHLRATVDTQRQTAATMATYANTGEAPRNFTRWGCRVCDFASLCRAELLGGVDGDYPLTDHGLRERVV